MSSPNTKPGPVAQPEPTASTSNPSSATATPPAEDASTAKPLPPTPSVPTSASKDRTPNGVLGFNLRSPWDRPSAVLDAFLSFLSFLLLLLAAFSTPVIQSFALFELRLKPAAYDWGVEVAPEVASQGVRVRVGLWGTCVDSTGIPAMNSSDSCYWLGAKSDLGEVGNSLELDTILEFVKHPTFGTLKFLHFVVALLYLVVILTFAATLSCRRHSKAYLKIFFLITYFLSWAATAFILLLIFSKHEYLLQQIRDLDVVPLRDAHGGYVTRATLVALVFLWSSHSPFFIEVLFVLCNKYRGGADVDGAKYKVEKKSIKTSGPEKGKEKALDDAKPVEEV